MAKKIKKDPAVLAFSKILHEEFERDGWGTIDPFYFEDPPTSEEASGEEMGGLYEVLERVHRRMKFGN